MGVDLGMDGIYSLIVPKVTELKTKIDSFQASGVVLGVICDYCSDMLCD